MNTPIDRPDLPRPPRQAAAPPSEPQPRRGIAFSALVAIGVALVSAIGLAALALALRGNPTNTDTGSGAAPNVTRSVAGPLAGRQEARFEMLSGAETVRVDSQDIGDDLYRISTPEFSSVVPKVDESGDRIALSLVSSGGAVGPASVSVLLNSRVRWQVRLAGGGNDEFVDFSSGRLASLDLATGAGRIEVAVPAPEGTLVVKLTGGAGQLTVRLPKGPPVQVRLGSGAGGVTVDGQRHEGLAPGTVLKPPGWDAAQNRLDVDAAGGVSTLVVERL
ncbi:MAG TPA: hypothetical protein VFC00_22085 [Micromonosporaceae bacterium]|nr:hypothetical protein [Micromonosporaceae bacterium]